MKRCLYCYLTINEYDIDFHAGCSKKIFGQAIPPGLEYSETQMKELATQVVKYHIAVTGVQPKLSLDLKADDIKLKFKRFTIIGLFGGYILKLRTQNYQQLPEVEDLTMH